jgi:hypothetical protein
MRLIINGFDIELEPDEKIARTLQVNDILTLSNRQSNYTNTFSIRRTDKNKKTFELLGVVGITNFLPYQKNECYLYTDDGDCIVYKGWAVIQSTDKEYKINIYDGNIDLYKAIENKNLGDLDLTEINHTKNLLTVVNSFTANLNYKYLIADYNGEMIYNINRINIDYLVPSVKVSYLWNKIFTTYGFTYSGSIFNTVNFTNLWLSYPKGQQVDALSTVYAQLTRSNELTYSNNGVVDFNTIVVNTGSVINNNTFIVPETGTYTLEAQMFGLQFRSTAFGFQQSPFEFYVNGNIVNNTSPPFDPAYPYGTVATTVVDLVIGSAVTVKIKRNVLWQNSYKFSSGGTSYFKISKFQTIVSFSNELRDFNTKDFISEILNRFGLTPFKDKYTNHYKFLTLQELLQTNQVIDWSRNKNKFTEFISENYIFGSYAQQNKLTYKYNDIESDYYNSQILIDNVNLQDAKTIVNSQIFAPEKEQTRLIHNLDCNVYKMWDKEVQDNGSVKYKGLQKRYYLMRQSSHTFTSPTQIGSKSQLSFQSITTVPVENFYNLPMSNIVQNYYSTIGAILNYSKIIKAKIYLTEKDISDIDFSKLYWIEELNSYFILNKVNNFIKKGITDVDLIKVDYSPLIPIAPGPEGSGINILIDLARNAAPILHFGFNQREITANAGEEITIYQDTIYNENEYDKPIITAPGATIIQSDINIIKVSFSTSGAKTLSASISNSSKSITVESNVLNITII